MNSQRITWFWPLSFLAVLGQLLLLLTHNEGGPALGRFALAAWTLWLPGVWLGNLLTKPNTGLPARLPVQASCALAVTFLLLQLRVAGALPVEPLARVAAGLSLAIGLIFVLLPGNRGGIRRPARWEAREVQRAEPQVIALLLVLVILVGLLGIWSGSPLSLRPDGADQVAAARLSGEMTPGFAPPPYHDAAGLPTCDPHRSLAHPLVDLLARLSNLPHARVWGFFPAVVPPLILLAIFALGRVVFRNENLAVASAGVYLLVTTAGLSNDSLRLAPYPDQLGLLPYWTAVGLFLDGLDRPHARGGIAFGLAALAAVGCHLGFGVLLLVVMIGVTWFTWMSVDRFLEAVPLLLVQWIPALVFVAPYLILRLVLLGSLEPFGVPAQGLEIVAPGRWTLSLASWGGALQATAWVGSLGVLALTRQAWHRITLHYLVTLTLLAVALGFNPWVTPWLERHLGTMVHMLIWLAPLPLALVGAAEWAGRGLARSESTTWLRFLVAGALAVVFVWLLGFGLLHFAYGPGRSAEARAVPPDSLRPLAEAVAEAFPDDPLVLSDPRTAAALAAYAPVRSVFAPPGVDAGRPGALGRVLAAREAFQGPLPHPFAAGEGDALQRFLRVVPAEIIVINRIPVPRALVDGWVLGPADAGIWASRLRADSTHYEEVALEPWGTAFRVANSTTGRGPEAWLEDGPGSLRPPASLTGPAPGLASLTADTLRVAAGETLTLVTRWSGAGAARAGDPRGYRLRVELRALPPGPPSVGSWFRSRWRSLTDQLSGHRHAAGFEHPLAEGRPPAWWPDEIEERTLFPVPKSLAPGTYEIRAAALPGPVSFDRVRPGLSFLPPAGQAVLVEVLPRNR